MPEHISSAIMATIEVFGDKYMAAEEQLSRENFELLTELHGIIGNPSYLDDLYSQTRGIFIMAKTIRDIDVSGVEPEMVFIPPTD